MCQRGFSPREKVLSVCVCLGTEDGQLQHWRPCCPEPTARMVRLEGPQVRTLTPVRGPLPLFPSSVFAGTRPHPWSSLEPSSSPSYCCEFSKCYSCRFPPPSTVFSSLCSDGEKEYIFPLPSAHHQQGCPYGKVQAAPGGRREVGFSPRGTFVQAEMLSAQPEQGSPGILMLLGWIDLRLNSACPSPCRLVL